MAYLSVWHVGPFVTSRDALSLGMVHFCTGVECKGGHLTERWACNNVCLACDRLKRLLRGPQVLSAEQKLKNAFWRQNNIEKARAYRRAGYQRRKAKELADCAAWRIKNAEVSRAIVRNYRAKLRTGGKHTAADVAEIVRLQGGKCAYCRKPTGKSYHVDHVQPVAKGGSNARSNIQITCQPCNLRKSDVDPIAFAQRLGLLI
jgi:5-methylcytosine-specific restriction endonuclease McrA